MGSDFVVVVVVGVGVGQGGAVLDVGRIGRALDHVEFQARNVDLKPSYTFGAFDTAEPRIMSNDC